MVFFGANGIRVAGRFGASSQLVAADAARVSLVLAQRAQQGGQAPALVVRNLPVPGYSYGQLVARSFGAQHVTELQGLRAFESLPQRVDALIGESASIGPRWLTAAMPKHQAMLYPTVADAVHALPTQLDFEYLAGLMAGRGDAMACARAAVDVALFANLSSGTGLALATRIDRMVIPLAAQMLGGAAVFSGLMAVALF